MPTALRSARKRFLESAALTRRAVERARGARTFEALYVVIAAYQATHARTAEPAVAAMLLEQGLQTPAAGRLNALAFTTSADALRGMLATTEAPNIDRLVTTLVQSAGRAGESVATATRKRVGHVRYLQLPSCSRCAVLAGRWYSVSDGFLRHPNCDCVMVPTSKDAAPGLTLNVHEAIASGQVSGLSKADRRAIADGADPSQVVNVRRGAAGLKEAGVVLRRGSRPTPAGIYRQARTHDEALELLQRFGYLL